jgi:hypothetical protein
MVKDNGPTVFDMGEQDFVFSENQLHVKSPAGKVAEYDVSTV